MKHAHFLRKLQDAAILDAIRAAEAKTSGEIRVYISESPAADVLPFARAQFQKLGMTRTRLRNGVLIYVAPESQTFAVIGDQAIHERCGDAFWQSITQEMTSHLKADAVTDAIVHGVKKVGDLLAEHFPRSSDDRNELPDRVERGQ